jgi:hypothetical protein
MGVDTQTHTYEQTATWFHKPTWVFENKESRLTRPIGGIFRKWRYTNLQFADSWSKNRFRFQGNIVKVSAMSWHKCFSRYISHMTFLILPEPTDHWPLIWENENVTIEKFWSLTCVCSHTMYEVTTACKENQITLLCLGWGRWSVINFSQDWRILSSGI